MAKRSARAPPTFACVRPLSFVPPPSRPSTFARRRLTPKSSCALPSSVGAARTRTGPRGRPAGGPVRISQGFCRSVRAVNHARRAFRGPWAHPRKCPCAHPVAVVRRILPTTSSKSTDRRRRRSYDSWKGGWVAASLKRPRRRASCRIRTSVARRARAAPSAFAHPPRTHDEQHCLVRGPRSCAPRLGTSGT